MSKKNLLLVIVLVIAAAQTANAVVVIGGSTRNGYLDKTVATEIVPGFFLPKPTIWQNDGFRTNTGAFEDEMSSEPWAGPAPTPVTTGGSASPPPPDGCGGADCGVFFKPFTGDVTTGNLATGHLYQDNPATPGLTYVLSGWAGAESNYSGLIPNTVTRSELAVEFLDAANAVIGGSVLDLAAAGLGSAAGQPFGYQQFTVSAVAPANAAFVRSRVSMIDAYANPMGGGQAFVVDDFRLESVPEPGLISLAGLAGLSILGFARKR